MEYYRHHPFGRKILGKQRRTSQLSSDMWVEPLGDWLVGPLSLLLMLYARVHFATLWLIDASRLFPNQKASTMAPCILFFDELDSLTTKRSLSGEDSTSNFDSRVLGTFLTELDGIHSNRGEVHCIEYMPHHTRWGKMNSPLEFELGRFVSCGGGGGRDF